MKNEIKEILKNYLNSGITTILMENISSDIFDDSVVIKSNIDVSELNGHYEDINFCPPSWYKKLVEKRNPILVIENINEINLEEQTKFVEILKYKKISTFDLPKNCIIIVTCSNLKNNKINEDIYSLLAHI